MINFEKKQLATIATIFLILAIVFPMLSLPTSSAHSPPWVSPTWTYISVSPNPIGVGQQALVVFWLDKLPQTATGEFGDRFTFYVNALSPSGKNESLGPFKSDPVGGGYTLYTPTETGNYTFTAVFPQYTYTGLPAPPGGVNSVYVNDTLLASKSPSVTLTVQQEPIPGAPSNPLPEAYWTTPIYGANRNWAVIAGNWLGGGNPVGNFNPYTQAPSTSHIVWAKSTTFGGIVGEPYGETSYHTGSAYETFWSAGIIIDGRLYYNEPKAPRYGWYCVDLRTGEQIFFQNSTGPIQIGSNTGAHISGTNIPWQYPQLAFGQIYNYDSPNQHGARAYVWSTYTQDQATRYNYTMTNGTIYSFNTPASSTVWQMYDAWTGNWICNIANVPAGTRVTGPNGELLIYIYNANGYLSLWNSSVALGWPNNNLQIPFGAPGGGTTEAYYWMWREPIGRTVDGTKGYSWNVTAPTNLGSISTVVQDLFNNPALILGTNGVTAFQYGVSSYSVWALNINQSLGQLMWKKDYSQPPVLNATITMGPASLADGIFTVRLKENLQWYGYNLNTGELAWGPSAASEMFDLYGLGGNIAYGRLYAIGYAGVLHAYDIKTGDLLWNSTTNFGGNEGPYENWPVGSGSGVSIADHKIYVTTGEHSHTQPLYTGWSIYCFDADTGRNLWNLTGLDSAMSISQGYGITFDNMDNRIYCFGKGDTATTISTTNSVGTLGNQFMLTGTVTDQSPGAKGTPAIADENMNEWMEAIYHQASMHINAKGVEVSIDAIDPNNNIIHIGNATSDSSGMYNLMFNPEISGLYTITASFGGSGSYFPSHAETAMTIVEPKATQPPTSGGGESTEPLGLYLLIATVAIIIAIALVGLALWRRR